MRTEPEEIEVMGRGVEGQDIAHSSAGGEELVEDELPEDIGGSKACILGGGMEVSSQVIVLSSSLALLALRKEMQEEHFQSFG